MHPERTPKLNLFQRGAIQEYTDSIMRCHDHPELIELGRKIAALPNCQWLKDGVRGAYQKKVKELRNG